MPSPFHREITRSFTTLPCEWRAFTLLSRIHKLCETVKPVKHGWVHTGILEISELCSGETVKAIFFKVLCGMYIRIFIPYSMFQETSKRFNKNVEAFEVKRRNVFKKHRGLLTSEWKYTFIGNLCNKMKNIALCKK